MKKFKELKTIDDKINSCLNIVSEDTIYSYFAQHQFDFQLIRRIIISVSRGFEDNKICIHSYGESIRQKHSKIGISRIVAKKMIAQNGFVNAILHKLSYFRLNYRFIDFANQIHVMNWMKYELYNAWLISFEGTPELGDVGDFLIQFYSDYGFIYREINLIIEPPIDYKKYNIEKKEQIRIFLELQEEKENKKSERLQMASGVQKLKSVVSKIKTGL